VRKAWLLSGQCVVNGNKAHGQFRANNGGPTAEYDTWSQMLNLCTNQKEPQYENIGGKGIKFDPRWDDFVMVRNKFELLSIINRRGMYDVSEGG